MTAILATNSNQLFNLTINANYIVLIELLVLTVTKGHQIMVSTTPNLSVERTKQGEQLGGGRWSEILLLRLQLGQRPRGDRVFQQDLLLLSHTFTALSGNHNERYFSRVLMMDRDDTS